MGGVTISAVAAAQDSQRWACRAISVFAYKCSHLYHQFTPCQKLYPNNFHSTRKSSQTCKLFHTILHSATLPISARGHTLSMGFFRS